MDSVLDGRTIFSGKDHNINKFDEFDWNSIYDSIDDNLKTPSLRLDKSGISMTVEELVQKGYVERKPSKEDRRYVVLNLTDKGSERLNKIEHDMDQKFKIILDKIPEDKRSQVIESLQLFNKACEVCE